MPSAKPVEVIVHDEEGTARTMYQGRWSAEEHDMFVRCFEQHGRQWKVLAEVITTRTVLQIRTHAQKYFNKLKRIAMNESSGSKQAPTSQARSRGSGGRARSKNRSKGSGTSTTRNSSSSSTTNNRSRRTTNFINTNNHTATPSTLKNTTPDLKSARTDPLPTDTIRDFDPSMKLMDGISPTDLHAPSSTGPYPMPRKWDSFSFGHIPRDASPQHARSVSVDEAETEAAPLPKRKRAGTESTLQLQDHKKQLRTPWEVGANDNELEVFDFPSHDNIVESTPPQSHSQHYLAAQSSSSPRSRASAGAHVLPEGVDSHAHPSFGMCPPTRFATPPKLGRRFNPAVDMSSPVALTDLNDFLFPPHQDQVEAEQELKHTGSWMTEGVGMDPPGDVDLAVEEGLPDVGLRSFRHQRGHSLTHGLLPVRPEDDRDTVALDVHTLAKITENADCLSFPENLWS